MKTWGHGEFSVRDIKVRGRITEILLQTTEKPLGSKTPGNCDREVVNHEKAGDTVGLEVHCFSDYKGPGWDRAPTLHELSDMDRNPLPNARNLGKCQLVSESRSEVSTQGGGLAVKFSFKLRVYDDDTLMQWLRDNKRPYLCLSRTQYELPVQDTEPKTRKKADKHDKQQTLDDAKDKTPAPVSADAVDPIKEAVGELPASPTIAERSEAIAQELQQKPAEVVSMADRAAKTNKR